MNPENPACPVAPADGTGVNPVKKEKSLAEKTVEDVLKDFGKTLKEARRRYREFACAVKSISGYFTGRIV